MVTIREENSGDIWAIRNLNELAFDKPVEANVVDRVRQMCEGLLSLVAIEADEVVGHILFSPVTVGNGECAIQGMGLGPMAVLPKRQRKGIGTVLVEHGLSLLREQNCHFVIVLGHVDYYPRFGFVPASRYGLKSQWEEIPDEAFMIMVFDQNMLSGVQGVVRYRDEFNEAM